MRHLNLSAVLLSILLIAMLVPAAAEVVYTPVNVSLPVDGSYYIDLNQDGVADFALRSSLLQDLCQNGDGYSWSLRLTPAPSAAAMIASPGYAAALLQGARIDSAQNFSQDAAVMTELEWGSCGRGSYGQWLDLPNRYLGLEFRMPGSPLVHYGWAKVSVVGYVDQHGHLQTSTLLQGFAYETVAGRTILAGQTSGE